MSDSIKKYFLPYQAAWLLNTARFKIWDKSRQIGASYVQSYEDVRDCIQKTVPAVWISTADATLAKEYINYCAQWARLYGAAGKLFDVDVVDDKGIMTTVIKFNNGTSINAMTSSPKALRGKRGKLVLDELAHHDDDRELWKAALPATTWGYPIRILSTQNGRSTLYNQFIEAIKSGKLDWYLQQTTIFQAVAEGLADKIMGRPLSEDERAAWIEDIRRNCVDEDTFMQEYCCIPIDATTAFLTYEMIYACEANDILWDDPPNISPLPLGEGKGEGAMFLGMDIGRKRDLSVIWLLEKLGDTHYTRRIIELDKMPFAGQKEILWGFLALPNLRRACIDATGLGMQLAEEAQNAWGKYKVEAVTFSAKFKEDAAYNLRSKMESQHVRIPYSHPIREDLHSVKKVVTSAGNIRFDAPRTDAHADRFWALALALHADDKNNGPIHIATRARRWGAKLLVPGGVPYGSNPFSI